MAKRITAKHSEKTRLKIQTSQLLNRLQSYAIGEIELETGQIKAIEVLLKKALPDLSSVQMSGPDGDDLKVAHRIELVGVPSGADK